MEIILDLVKDKNKYASRAYLFSLDYDILAGDESHAWNPLLVDCIYLSCKLEQLGFTYYKGKVIILEPIETQMLHFTKLERLLDE